MAITLNNTVYSNGEGVPLVMVHAFPVDHHMWDECAAKVNDVAAERGLAPVTVWAPDMPGAGIGPVPSAADSGEVAADGAYEQALDLMTDAYADLVRAAGYERAVWAGLSMGGYVVLDMQRRHPEMIAGLALCDTKADADSPAARAGRLECARACESGETVDPVMHFADASEHDSSFKKSQAGHDLFTRWIREQTPQGVAWRQRMAAGRPDLNDQLPLVTASTAVICGENDPFSQPAAMRSLADAMTGTNPSFTVLPDCGHFSAVEYPRKVAELLVDLVERVR
ncbi:alpha/beta fold hydrolase [Bifidobacterium leontopitheci]|uniref:Alpha/beta hydrolase n=1 Tax=Bifidobacterium leontopitheci TaxID=2650774 RepID=A0A6I1GFL7_9BIFI|nr:alpha/beta hydrolase [Bifidobacterium leontopitheci]KAB7790450.1 alpha/beta hydrolase [Bifidobacterium leontopitheci]